MTPPRRFARFLRYAIGSGLAAATSGIVFALAYRVLDQDPRVATGAAAVSGALVNFAASRFWAWNLRARRGLAGHAVAYATLAVVAAIAAAAATSATHALLRDADPNRRAVLVEASFFATYALLFVVKFVVLDRVIFRPRGSSRSQVPSTTRA